MLYILWGLLNVGVGFYFLSLCFRATKLIRLNLGLFASIVFVFGLLSFAGNSASKHVSARSENNQVKKWTFTSGSEITSDTRKFTLLPMDKTLLSTTDLTVLWGRAKTSTQPLPIEATSTTAGFVSGHKWQPTYIRVDTTATAGKLRYEVSGVLEWNLLGATIYVQPKTYAGFLDVR